MSERIRRRSGMSDEEWEDAMELEREMKRERAIRRPNKKYLGVKKI